VNIVPDYSKSILDVYTEATFAYLRLYGLTRTLNLARKDTVVIDTTGWREDDTIYKMESYENKFELPSWVPDVR